MAKLTLKPVRGYDPKTQTKIGFLAAQLDDQLKLLTQDVKGLTVKQLEWQQRPGMNTIGMLLAHLALVEVWWITIACKGISEEKEVVRLIKQTCGFEDDGIPLPADGKPPRYLQGMTLDNYLSVLRKARRKIHAELRSWRDADLGRTFKLRKNEFSLEWVNYHVAEHFSGHYGQILLIKHQMRDAGVLKAPKTKK